MGGMAAAMAGEVAATATAVGMGAAMASNMPVTAAASSRESRPFGWDQPNGISIIGNYLNPRSD
jgi:hypothetical protein